MALNSNTLMATIGASNNSEHKRAEHDLYTTSQKDFVRFLKALQRDGVTIEKPVLEPCAGLGHLVEVMERLGWSVVAQDVVDRTEWENCKKVNTPLRVIDFMEMTQIDWWQTGCKTILTNPPYSLGQNIVEHSLKLLESGQNLILLFRIQWLESQKRYELFKKSPPKYVYIYTARCSCSFNGVEDKKEASAVCFAWFIWEKGFDGEPRIRFIE